MAAEIPSARVAPITNPASLAAIIARETRATPLKSAAIAHNWDDATKAKSFFSARVAAADILEGLREQINMAVSGQMSPDQAVLWMREFLKSQGDSALTSLGFLPAREALGEGLKTAPITELASSPRLKLIVEQNTRMAQSAADWENMMEAADILPFVRYHTAADGEVRDEHAILDGKIWRKDDPQLPRIYPPNGFNCRCWVEEIDEDDADGQRIESGAPSGWEDVERDYSYDPERYSSETIEAKAKWGGDLTAAYNADSAEYQIARVADLERRRDILLAAANNSQDPREIGDAVQSAQLFDKRIEAIKATKEYQAATTAAEKPKDEVRPGFVPAKTLDEARQMFIDLGFKPGEVDLQTIGINDIIALNEALQSLTELKAQGYNFTFTRVGLERRDNVYASAGRGMLQLNPLYMNSPNDFVSSLKKDVSYIFHPEGCDTIKSLFDHEFAHMLSIGSLWYKDDEFTKELGKIKRQYNKEIKGIIAKHKVDWWTRKNGLSEGNIHITSTNVEENKKNKQSFIDEVKKVFISGYAEKDNHEFCAEGFTSAINSPSPSPYAIKIKALVDKHFKKGTI